MGRSLLRALIAAQDPSPVQGPTVHAVHCANGHLNPAHASVCRACGAPVLAEAPLTVPRPVLGALRLSTGDVIPLDRGVLLGRHPKGSAAGPDAERHVVRVPSPNGDISRAHTEIRLDGWHVLAVDLNSTNGTVVVPPGRAPERLRPNEARPIEPGTVVLLSDDVSFRFEVEP
jgi:pSer/pThr/pTyr-binding forkhead associated (FHA) protein